MKTLFAVGIAGALAAAGAEGTNSAAGAGAAIVELGLRPAPNFNPEDPIVIESITNTSERVVYYHHVPVAWYDRSQMGPHVRVDGLRPEEVEDPFGWAGADMLFGTRRALSPRAVREIVWRLRDQFQIPAQWTNLWVHTGDPHVARSKVWIILDRAGRVVTQGMDSAQAADAPRRPSGAPPRLFDRIELPTNAPSPQTVFPPQ